MTIEFELEQTRELKNGDFFVWVGNAGIPEIHCFHSNAGYGIKTWTDYDEKVGSSVIVTWSGVCGKVKIKSKKP